MHMLTVNKVTLKNQDDEPYFRKSYTQMLFDDGHAVYLLDGKQSTESNNIFDYDTVYKQRNGKLLIDYDKKTYTDDEYIKHLEKQIDEYVEYIEDGRQYRAALARNAEIRTDINKFKQLFELHSNKPETEETQLFS